MGTFDSFADTPKQIKTEGEKIVLQWLPGVTEKNTENAGTLRWNIPSPARGCTTIADGTSAYCGIVLVAQAGIPVDGTNIPTDGTKYLFPEPTVNPDLHTGDKIGDALVIGAFYEGEKKAKGEELTTSLEVFDLDPNTPYFFAAYATTCQSIHHKEGVRAYSAGVDTSPGESDTPSNQVVALGSGVDPFDDTGLDPTRVYKFDLIVSDTYPSVTSDQTISFEIPGGIGSPAGIGSPTLSLTYEQLVTEINRQIALSLNPLESPTPPNTGLYYCSPDGVLQWDGTKHVPVDNVAYEPSDPADPGVGDYWFNPDSKKLKRWNIPLPIGWNDIADVTEYGEDPRQLETCDNYWFDGTKAYSWCSPTWCEETLINSTTDPSLPPELTCCPIWFDTLNEIMYEWDPVEEGWEETAAIKWPEAPTALSDGTFWFDLTNDILYERQVGVWVEQTDVIIECDEPTQTIPDGTYWYNPDTEELKIWNGTGSPPGWGDLDVLVWPTDPTDVESCDLWWNGVISKWDTINLTWNAVEQIFKQDVDPRTPPTIEKGVLWYNPDTKQLQIWDGQDWQPASFITDGNDPTDPVVGAAWHDTSNDLWYIWGTPNVGDWNVINPIDSTIDPFLTPQGALWQNTISGTLFQRVGLTWVTIPCSSQSLAPERGTLWYDTQNNVLMEWDGTQWIESDDVPVTADLNDNGNLEFITTATGSTAVVMIIVPENVPSGVAQVTGYGCNSIYSCLPSIHSFAFYAPNECCTRVPTTDATPMNFLFSQIDIALIKPQYHGSDAISNQSSYEEIGIGTDGTPDEKRELMNELRSQLGYPSVEVELDNHQLDTSVRKALDKFRQLSVTAYNVGHFFLDIVPGQSSYILTDRTIGYNKVVTVMAAYRFTSAFLSTAHGAGVYGQVVLQHLYNMGTYDLTSYHLISQYIEQLEHLFATRLTFNWIEQQRKLKFYQAFSRRECVLLETTVEKTEQEILKDRWSKTWIERWALSEARTILSGIRGKYSTLPGAGGGVSLNAADLQTLADNEQEKLLAELDDFVSNTPEDIGMHSTFIIG